MLSSSHEKGEILNVYYQLKEESEKATYEQVILKSQNYGDENQWLPRSEERK